MWCSQKEDWIKVNYWGTESSREDWLKRRTGNNAQDPETQTCHWRFGLNKNMYTLPNTENTLPKTKNTLQYTKSRIPKRSPRRPKTSSQILRLLRRALVTGALTRPTGRLTFRWEFFTNDCIEAALTGRFFNWLDRQVSEDYGEDERERLQEELSAVKRRFSHNKVKRKWVSERFRFLLLPSLCFVLFGLDQAGLV